MKRAQDDDSLRRLLNPVGAIVITRDRVQEVLDDAVLRGRMTRDDATDLLLELIRCGGRATGLAGFPIAGYDELTAAEVGRRLDGLGASELREVREHERRNANRKSVLAAIDRKLP